MASVGGSENYEFRFSCYGEFMFGDARLWVQDFQDCHPCLFGSLGSSSKYSQHPEPLRLSPQAITVNAAEVPSSHEAAGGCRFLETEEVRERGVKQQDLM